MDACLLRAVGDIRIEAVATPVPEEGEVLLGIKASGICGSDIPRVFVKGTYSFPTIPGHEFAGQIVDVGKGIDKQMIGQKAAVFPLLPCMKCDACQIGEYAQCKSYSYFGSRRDGGFAEYMAVPLWNIVPVSESLSYEEAAMAEPAAVALHALRQAGIEPGDNVMIFGAGPIGLILAQWARTWGADKVMLADIDEDKLSFARGLGFTDAVNSRRDDPVKWSSELTLGKGVDVLIEGAGASVALEQCLFSARPFGRIVAMGNPAGDMHISQKAYWELLRKQLKLFGTWNSNYTDLPKNDWKVALESMASGRISVKPLITHRFPLGRCKEALEMMRDRSEFFCKVMFIIDQKGGA